MKNKSYLLATAAISISIILFILYKAPRIFTSDKLDAVKIYYADNISSAHQKMISLFNEKYKGRIEIVAIDLPFSKFTTNERKEILARSLRSKTDRMDVFAIDLIWGPRFAKWSFDLSPYFSDLQLQKYTDHALTSCLYNDKLISIPFYTDVGLMYYRKDILEKFGFTEKDFEKINASISWEEFIQLGEKIKAESYPVFLFSGDSYEGMICSFHEMISLRQSDEIFQHDQIDLNKKPALQGLSFMVDLIYKYKFTPPQVLQFDENKSKMYALQHDAVFLRGWPGFFNNPDELQDYQDLVKYYKMAPLPHFKGQKHNAVFGGWNLMISKYSKNKMQALEFLKFATSIEMQKVFYEEVGYFPIRKEIYSDSLFIKRNQELQNYENLFKRGRHRPFRENYTKMSDIMSHYFHQALEGKITPKEALLSANKEINSRQVFLK